ncbi:MAG: tRNA (adenosine(37)-N6)-threonylcarbamoyltransferase complex dimerization subunit type 1 TsaB [Paracoccus sp. (in: a-proteobacteria)]|nr:tRNA (adenosine(37)-N6)-threonylcarbamoyltransferase complex dimerization subunit type 1 TsaB [Paracoccus sp. (in: a-proteobacteria)]
MPDLVSIGFDTSAAHCAAALLRGERVLAARHEEMARGQSERLMPMLAQLLGEAGLDWSSIDVIGVGTGPGNFTGIRVAVAAARGLALALERPAIGVTATEAAAFGLARPCRVILEGRGGTVIWQDFHDPRDGVARDETGAARHTTSGGLPQDLPLHATDASDVQESRPRQAATGALPPGPAPAAPVMPPAVAIARLAAQAACRGHEGVPRPAPTYLRPADAAPARDPAPRIL